jgi:hypothetical protein
MSYRGCSASEDGFGARVEEDAGADDHIEDNDNYALQPEDVLSAQMHGEHGHVAHQLDLPSWVT